jgi:hypothetical protein
MFVVFLFSWYRLEHLACFTLEQISEIGKFQILNGLSFVGDRPNANPPPTQHNRNSEKVQTHELVYILALNLVLS